MCLLTVMSLVLSMNVYFDQFVVLCVVLCVLMALGIFMFVKVMSSLITVMSPLLVCTLCLCVWWCSEVFLVCYLSVCVLFTCIVMMPGWVLCTSFF